MDKSMLTDKQVALLTASIYCSGYAAADILKYADRFLKWLNMPTDKKGEEDGQ